MPGHNEHEFRRLAPTRTDAGAPGRAPAIGWKPSLFSNEVLFAIHADRIKGDPTAHVPEGLLNSSSSQPLKSRIPALADGGLKFTGSQFLLRQGTSFGASMFRGFLVIFKVHDPDKSGQAHLVAVNANGDWDTPSIRYEKGRLVGRWDTSLVDRADDEVTSGPIERIEVACGDVVTDGATWNVAVVGRHDSYLFTRLNGNPATSRSHPDLPYTVNNNTNGQTIIGLRADQGDNCAIVIKDMIAWQGELSEAWVRKAEDWAASRADRPLFHGTKPPIYEASDRPYCPQFDKVAWSAWVAANPRNAAKYRARMGEPALPLDDYTPVYREDFRTKALGSSSKINKFNATLKAQGGNPAVGGDPATRNPFLEDIPAPVYEYDADEKSLTLCNQFYGGRWNSAAVTSVSNSVHGRSWEGGYVLRWRDQYGTDIAGRLFWGRGWGYGLMSRRYHHIPRQEIDFNEPDAINRFYGNLFSVHNHSPHLVGGRPAPHHKIIGEEIKVAKGWPVDLDQWNGRPITWEVRVDPDYVYLNVDLTSPADMLNRKCMVEWMRFATPPGFLERWYFMFNTAMKKGGDWEPDRKKSYPFTLHEIQVWQRNEIVNAVPDVFVERPALTRKGEELILHPNLCEPLNFVEYVWSGTDGYQLGVTREPHFRANEPTKVLVRAIGATNLPEAWSNTA